MPTDRTNTNSAINGGKNVTVLAIECLNGSSKADEWTGDTLQTGDIVEEIKIGNYMSVTSPFKNGKNGIQKILHSSFKDKETSIRVRVRRGKDEFVELQACLVPNEFGGKKQYMLRSIDDPNYAVGFVDRTETDCLALQATRNSRLVSALTSSQLQNGYVSYPWETRMQELLQVPCSSCFLSILLLPKVSNSVASRYNDLEDTLARGHVWLNASQASGVPVVFMNIQTESLLTKISGETASATVNTGSLSDLTNLANASLYGFEDYHGVDIGVVRAVRLWYAPLWGELEVEIKLQEGDTKLGFAISRTEEGFIYISSVIDGDENVASTRSGLSSLYKDAVSASKLLVVSRVSNQKVLPWMVSSTGGIRCYDTVSLSQKLSLHRHARVPITLHVFMCGSSTGPGVRPRSTPAPPPAMRLPPRAISPPLINENQVVPLPSEISDEREDLRDSPGYQTERDTAGDVSFRFHYFSLSNNWV